MVQNSKQNASCFNADVVRFFVLTVTVTAYIDNQVSRKDTPFTSTSVVNLSQKSFTKLVYETLPLAIQLQFTCTRVFLTSTDISNQRQQYSFIKTTKTQNRSYCLSWMRTPHTCSSQLYWSALCLHSHCRTTAPLRHN